MTIKISDAATKSEIVEWTREQFAKNDAAIDVRVPDDVVVGMLCLSLVQSDNPENIATAMRVAARVGSQDFRAALARAVATLPRSRRPRSKP